MTSSETTFNDEELIARLRDSVSGEHDMTPHGADVLQAADRIEALTKERDQHWDSFVHWRKEADARSEQLAAARRDAEIAEEELELQEEEACMMENSYLELKKERDALDAKLTVAVEAITQIAEQTDGVMPEPENLQIAIGSINAFALATLAEIKGEIP